MIKIYRGVGPVLVALFFIAIIAACSALFYMIDAPLLDSFGFRQTQTAISTRWLVENGPAVFYETPVLGYPWSIPFEFPIYQNIVALLSKYGVALEVSGRIVSIFFFFLSLPMVFFILLYLGKSQSLALSGVILVIASPLYVFWSRTFMIESTALFFSLLWLALVIKILKGDQFKYLLVIFALVAGSLATLSKATTFPAFCVAACLIALQHSAPGMFNKATSWRARANCFQPLVIAILLALAPLFVGVSWVSLSDSVKILNPFGSFLTSQSLEAWNYGTFEQRASTEFWVTKIFLRTGFEVFGYGIFFVPIAFLAALCHRETRSVALIFLVSCLAPLLVFTNLYFVHNYYAFANMIFALLVYTLGLQAISKVFQGIKIEYLIALTLIGQISYYSIIFVPIANAKQTEFSDYVIANAARDLTSADSALIVFGRDWSSEIPFYAQRYSIAIPGWADEEMLEKAFYDLEQTSGGLKLGGIILCGEINDLPQLQQRYAAGILRDAVQLSQAGICKFFKAHPPFTFMLSSVEGSVSLANLLRRGHVDEGPYGVLDVEEGVFPHPPSSISITRPLPAALAGKVGFMPSTPLEEAETFIAEVTGIFDDGTSKILFSSVLDPSLDGYTPLSFSLSVPTTVSSLQFNLRPAGESNQFGWIYWGN